MRRTHNTAYSINTLNQIGSDLDGSVGWIEACQGEIVGSRHSYGQSVFTWNFVGTWCLDHGPAAHTFYLFSFYCFQHFFL